MDDRSNQEEERQMSKQPFQFGGKTTVCLNFTTKTDKQ